MSEGPASEPSPYCKTKQTRLWRAGRRAPQVRCRPALFAAHHTHTWLPIWTEWSVVDTCAVVRQSAGVRGVTHCCRPAARVDVVHAAKVLSTRRKTVCVWLAVHVWYTYQLIHHTSYSPCRISSPSR